MTIYQILKQTGLPVAYSHFKREQAPPYIVYIGNGQDTFPADNTFYTRRNTYQIEYYFTEKDEAAEDEIENLLLVSGFYYEKSADSYIEDQGVFLIYYTAWTHEKATLDESE